MVLFLDDEYSIVSGVIGMLSLQWYQLVVPLAVTNNGFAAGKRLPFSVTTQWDSRSGNNVRLLSMYSGPNFFILLYLARYSYHMLLG